MTALRAGAASADITPPVGVMLDGYGNRLTPSEGVHDPLFARALVLDYGPQGAAAIVVCDLLGVHPWMASELRRRAAVLGIAAEAVLLAATHNHAAPIGLRSGMFSRLDEALAEATVSRAISAIEEAWSRRRPASIKTGGVPVRAVAMNRRDPAGPTDADLRVVLFDSDEGPLASLLSFACHATVLSGANLHITAEFPGAACRIAEGATGAPAVYLQGACGDVNPVWMAQDFASVERAGQAVGGAAVNVIAGLRAAGRGLRAHNIRWDEFTEAPVAGRVVEPRLRAARREVALPMRTFADDEEYAAHIAEIEARIGQGWGPDLREEKRQEEKRAAMAQLTRWQNERWAAAWSRRSGERGARRTEIQALSLGDGLAVVALPGEFFAETARMIREKAGIEQLLAACYANDYVGYVVPAEAYGEGGYESGVTFFEPETESIIRQAALSLLKEIHGS